MIIDLSDSFTVVTAEEARFEAIQRLEFDAVSRKVWVTSDIEPEFGAWFARVLDFLTRQSDEPIEIYINTPGGDVQSMFAFYDSVQSSACEITTIGHQQVCSAGVLMLACGHRRLVYENCVVMSHEGTTDGDVEGLRYSEAKDRRKWEDWCQSRWFELMARHTGKDAAYWKSITNRRAEHWIFGGDDIVAEGLADHVIKPIK